MKVPNNSANSGPGWVKNGSYGDHAWAHDGPVGNKVGIAPSVEFLQCQRQWHEALLCACPDLVLSSVHP